MLLPKLGQHLQEAGRRSLGRGPPPNQYLNQDDSEDPLPEMFQEDRLFLQMRLLHRRQKNPLIWTDQSLKDGRRENSRS